MASALGGTAIVHYNEGRPSLHSQFKLPLVQIRYVVATKLRVNYSLSTNHQVDFIHFARKNAAFK